MVCDMIHEAFLCMMYVWPIDEQDHCSWFKGDWSQQMYSKPGHVEAAVIP